MSNRELYKPIMLAVDLSYQVHRACHAFSNLRSIEGEFTGGLFGFMVTVGKIIRDSQADRVVVCADRKPYLRSLEYSDYKNVKRKAVDPDDPDVKEQKERVRASIILVREFLDLVGIPILEVPGFEADDCIGHIATRHRHRYDMVYAASNDSDLFQLLHIKNFCVWKKDADVVDAKEVMREFGLTPYEYMYATAMTGTHNDVEGIDRVGIKTAAKALRDPKLMSKYQAAHKSLIERNLRLIKLPHDKFPPATPVPVRTRSLDERALIRWCSKYDINVTQSMLSAYE